MRERHRSEDLDLAQMELEYYLVAASLFLIGGSAGGEDVGADLIGTPVSFNKCQVQES